MVNRREFIATSSAAAIGLTLVDESLAATVVPRRALTIADILPVAWPAVVQELCNGRPFADHILNAFVVRGDIKVAALGPLVEWCEEDGTRKITSVRELQIPVVWSAEDDLKNSREADKISFTQHLIQNTIWAHDDVLMDALGIEAGPFNDASGWHYSRDLRARNRMAVSRHFRYDLGAIKTFQDQSGQTHYQTYAYAAYAVLLGETDAALGQFRR